MAQRVFEVSLTVKDPISICQNKEVNVLNKIKEIYEHHCFLKCYIKEVKQILQTSDCKIISNNNFAHGVINVRFLADVIVFLGGSIVAKMKTIKYKDMLLGVSPDEVVITTFIDQKETEALKSDKFVPVRLIRTLHAPFQTKISAYGNLLMCDTSFKVYMCQKNLNVSQMTGCQRVIQEIKDELEVRKSIPDTKLMFFEKMFYAYANNNEMMEVGAWKGLKFDTSNCINILELFSKDDFKTVGFWARPLFIARSSPMIVSLPNSENYIEEPANVIFENFLLDILYWIKAINQMTEAYSESEISSQTDVWRIIKSKQIKR
ncbi:Uncharacterised protein [uncultured archaeon]|nr:Uncharacterised protein [uncultured archaeon]